jgi:phage-related protein
LQQALARLVEKTKGSKAALIQLLGSQEAVQAALQLSGENTLSFNQTMDEMRNKAGATAVAVGKMQDTHDNRVARMKASLESLKITIGNRLLVALEPVITKIGEWINRIDVWMAKHPKMASVIAGSLGVITLLGIALGAVAAVMGLLSLVSIPVLIVFAKVIIIVGLVVAAFMLLRPVLMKLWRDNQDVVQGIKTAWDWFVANIWPVIKTLIGAFIQFEITVWSTMFRGVGRAIGFAIDIVRAWWSETKANLQMIMDLWTIFKEAISPVTQFVVKIFEKFKTGIGDAISGVVGFIQGLIDKIVEFLNKMPLVQKSFEVIGKAFRFGKKIFGDLTDNITAEFDQISNSIENNRSNIHQLAENIRNKNTVAANLEGSPLGLTTGENSANILTSPVTTSSNQPEMSLASLQSRNITLAATKNPNVSGNAPEIINEINVPPAKITPADIILDKQKIGKVVFEMQQLQTVRSN